MVIEFLLIAIILWILFTQFNEPPVLREVRRRYDVLRANLPEKFSKLRRPAILVTNNGGGDIGYNINKGFEIHLCLGDGNPDHVFHVLLHELAHNTVPELDHSEAFWANMNELVDIATRLGIYNKLPHRKNFCGGTITDV